MDTVNRRVAEEIFQRAADLPPEERSALLDRECRDDAALRSEVESLLTCLEEGRIASLQAVDLAEDPEPDLVGTRLGPYRLVELIGEGGFGCVYAAAQEEPIRRSVAVKVIKLGMDTRRVISRFEAERQALALMDHPGIAKVLDAGTTDTGRPYFVMELVRGIPITEYCDAQGLSVRERLALFVAVCEAVQHAHQKGIIHRDLKPSNVLVNGGDGGRQPKVIDFGVAKAVGRRLTDQTISTGRFEFVGTPEYMSPEQAEIGGIDVDTRSDVYSLGVLLYVLLTGAPPFDSKTLGRPALAEIQRIIREVDPPTPSHRLDTLGTELPGVASRRSVGPESLRRLLRGDLDWIVMRALEKERTRRYESCGAFAADIERHLRDEPVLAGPPGAGYRFRKFVRRHRVGVAAGIVVVLALVAGLGLATLGYVRAKRAQEELTTERDLADAARTEAEAVSDFLSRTIASVTPAIARGQEVTVRYALDESARRLADGSLEGQPLVEASVRVSLGDTYMELGLFEDAESQYRTAIPLFEGSGGPEDPRTLRARSKWAKALSFRGRYAEAEALYREVLEVQRRVLGDEHPDALVTMNGLGITLWRQGRNDEAERIHGESLAAQRRVLGEEHIDTMRSMLNLGTVYWQQGRYEDAERLQREALELHRRILGEEHPATLKVMNNFALVLRALGRHDEGEALHRRALELQESVLGDIHPDTRISRNNLIHYYLERGRVEDARPYVRDQIEERRRIWEESDGDPSLLNEYAWLLLTCVPADLRDLDEGLALAERAHALAGDGEANILDTLAAAWLLHGDVDRAVEFQRRAVVAARPGTRFDRRRMEARLAEYVLARRETPGQGAAAVEAEVKKSAKLPVEKIAGESVLVTMARALEEGGNFDAAEALLLEAWAVLDAGPDTNVSQRGDVARRLASLYEAWGRAGPAARWRIEAEATPR